MIMPGQGADRKLDRSVVLADMARGLDGVRATGVRVLGGLGMDNEMAIQVSYRGGMRLFRGYIEGIMEKHMELFGVAGLVGIRFRGWCFSKAEILKKTYHGSEHYPPKSTTPPTFYPKEAFLSLTEPSGALVAPERPPPLG